VLQSIHRLASKIHAHVRKYFKGDPGKFLRDDNENGKEWLIKQFTHVNNTCEKEQLLKQWDTNEERVLEEYLINKTNKVISDEKKFNKLYTYDWNKVAKHVTTGTGKTRTAKDCQIKVEGCPDTGLLTYIIGAKKHE
jgi:DNA-binding response OmpR family regulator